MLSYINGQVKCTCIKEETPMVAAPGLEDPKAKVWIPKGRPVPFHDGPPNDQLMAMVMALTVEYELLPIFQR